MSQYEYELRMLEWGLERKDLFSKDDIERIKQAQRSMTSPLLKEAKRAFKRGNTPVAMALVKAAIDEILLPLDVQSCVIYCRVSTEGQTKGMGLWRQLDTCQRYAQDRNLSVIAAFSEVASGIDPLPIRAQAQRMAESHGCQLLCEDHSRWSRKGSSDAPPAYVVMASDLERALQEELHKLFAPVQMLGMTSAMEAAEAETVQ